MLAPNPFRYQPGLPLSFRFFFGLFMLVAFQPHAIGAVEKQASEGKVAEANVAEANVVEEKGAVDVIVVTAQKREESVQDVPIGITVLNGDDITSYGISEPLAIAQFTPGVHARPTVAGSNPLFSIRGMGFNDFTSIPKSEGSKSFKD